jgi:hypothetical protein
VEPVQLNASKLYPLPTNNPASGCCAVPLENNTDKPPRRWPAMPPTKKLLNGLIVSTTGGVANGGT